LLHELSHIKHEDVSPVDEDICSPEAMAGVSEMEARANAEAANTLVAADRLESFIKRHSPLYYEKEVVRFAQSIPIHPGIVVGQLQCRKELDYKQLRKYLPLDRDILIGKAITDGWGNALGLGDE
jgi:HTH-type transcriptional regulator/antitoxin HigA